MKKLLLSALAVCAFSFSNAQEEKTSTSLDVTFGVKAGLNLATLTVENTDVKAGYHVGAMAEIKLNDKFSIQPELLFSAQGTKYNEGNEDKNILSYINLPIMGKYYVTEGLSLEVGPQIGFLVNAETEFDGEYFDIENTNTIDFGVDFGLGYKLDSGLNFSARYNYGLTNFNSDSDFVAKNSVFQFSVGYFFN